jgi:diaminohydroxyphosphoribosylaminopyrimidine deaminase/5-amino-6-(5-phosphoribosylamino)uracil reductase
VNEVFMRLALREAEKGLGRTSPNPPVGAVLVRDGRVVGMGHHERAGGPHAELFALQAAGELARGATLYVTLEPCAHHGRTPPCAPAVAAAGVSRVFVGSPDPNPLVAGRGIRTLRDAGLEVEVGLLREACDELIEGWAHFLSTGRPFVILKAASTLDGRIATKTGDSKWITGEAARREVHGLRDRADAVLVGRGTVEADDPQLTTRLEGGRDALRVILDSTLSVRPDARIFRTGRSKVLVACAEGADESRAEALRKAGAEILVAGRGRVELPLLLAELGRRNVAQLLVEGGARIFGSFLAADLVDRLVLHYGPKVFGAGPAWTDAPAAERVADALSFELRSSRALDGDLVVELRPRRDYTVAWE